MKYEAMTAYVYIGKDELINDARLRDLTEKLRSGGWTVTCGNTPEDIVPGMDMVLSVGGDGTFLSVSAKAAITGVPVVGVNLGRLGFLSENRPDDVAEALLGGSYTIEDRTLLNACLSRYASEGDTLETIALNEITVHRSGAAMLGVDVSVDGVRLPTYWADGLVISTSSGSTAYSLSVGGPIVLPQSRVLIISPIAPHNLNVRPLVVPDTAKIELSMRSRDDKCTFTSDNSTYTVSASDARLSVSMARFSLKRVRLEKSEFINALTEKLFWGEDVRNIK